jgi:8-oxo-dGTP pyrophosphatase MutT (NUDIX family)
VTPEASPLCDTPASWDVVDTRVVFEGAVVDIRADVVVMPDGGTAEREILVHPGSVGVLPLDDEGRVLVLRQYRHAVRARLWELPAGLLDVAGEEPLLAARRELFEEAHLEADDWRVLVDAYTTPGMSDEAVRIFLARGARPVDGDQHARVHEEAELELRWVHLDDLVRGVLAGELHNPLIVMGALALYAARTRPGGLDALRPADAPWPARPF